MASPSTRVRKPLLQALFCLSLWLFTSSPIFADGQKWAVIVGIDHYDQPDIAALQYAEADAHAMVDSLHFGAHVDDSHIVLLTGQGDTRTKASRANVIDSLVRLREQMHGDDTFIFYFAGHGVSIDKQGYLLTSDTIPLPVENLQQTALSLDTLRGLLEKLPASRVLVAIDACRSDPRSGRGTDDNPMQEPFSRGLTLKRSVASTQGPTADVTATLFACRVGERSYEWPEKHHGYFTYYLAAGLRGAAADDHGQVTLTSLVSYLESHVGAEVAKVRGNAYQTPWAEIQGNGASTWELAHVQPGQDANAPSLDNPVLARAQEAFAAGHYGEPEVENAIELSLAAQKQVANDPVARALEERAVAAYENEAKTALDGNDRARALAIYERLYHIYPTNQVYLGQVTQLSLAVAPDILGTWEFSYVAKYHWTFAADGTLKETISALLISNSFTGNWTWDPENKRLQVFIHGPSPLNTVQNVTLSDDLQTLSFTGSGNLGTRQITAHRVH